MPATVGTLPARVPAGHGNPDIPQLYRKCSSSLLYFPPLFFSPISPSPLFSSFLFSSSPFLPFPPSHFPFFKLIFPFKTRQRGHSAPSAPRQIVRYATEHNINILLIFNAAMTNGQQLIFRNQVYRIVTLIHKLVQVKHNDCQLEKI